jgi:hypothetical protein
MAETDFESKLPVRTSGVYDGTSNKEPSNTGLVAHTRATTPGNAEQVQRLTGVTSASVHALDVSLHDQLGNAYSSSNPMYVNVVNGAVGSAVLDYHEYEDLAKATPTAFTYTPAAGVIFTAQRIHLSASGRFKAVIAIGTTASEDIKIVLFNSTATPNADYEFALPQDVLETESIKVTVTNLDREVQSVYMTIEGVNNPAP